MRRATRLLVLVAAAVASCDDGGWGTPRPDPYLGPPRDVPADAASETTPDAPADTPVDPAPDASAEPGAPDTGTDLAAFACGQGPGNEIGVGRACTKGGGQCGAELSCDVDLDPKGAGACIKLPCETDADCGAFATCCLPGGSPLKVCIIDPCLPPECRGGGTPDGAPDAAPEPTPDVPGEEG